MILLNVNSLRKAFGKFIRTLQTKLVCDKWNYDWNVTMQPITINDWNFIRSCWIVSIFKVDYYYLNASRAHIKVNLICSMFCHHKVQLDYIWNFLQPVLLLHQHQAFHQLNVQYKLSNNLDGLRHSTACLCVTWESCVVHRHPQLSPVTNGLEITDVSRPSLGSLHSPS